MLKPKPGEVIFEAFQEWARLKCLDWRELEQESFDVLVSAFTGGYLMSVRNSVESNRIKQSMDLMASVEVSKVPQ